MDKTALLEAPMQLLPRCQSHLHTTPQTHLHQVVPTKHHVAKRAQIEALLVAEFCLPFRDHGHH